ncbi:phospho-N-acetylmuramoyl-pentapeptide-transferase [Blattabacterium cuenoti]|uniref:phospho-N-acetylmuramoyl-pentapeptide- transferase n=1 Tax=Blattabacterium cuenoti TaxID=1653831 RepID=UPI00163BECF2|nr:phospho-N-acetylmuramoyl-pentapeptide-transferase [Blattabacterium cuenoti]
MGTINHVIELFHQHSLFYRSFIAFFFSFFISFIFYEKIILFNKSNRISENIRFLGILGEKDKQNVPTMGGLGMILSTFIATLLFSSLNNVYIFLLIIVMLMTGCVGFLDDYIKIKYHKKGLSVISKILGQIVIGTVVGTMMYFHPDISPQNQENIYNKKKDSYGFQTDIPIFFMHHSKKSFDYSYILSWYSSELKKYTWIIFIPIIILKMIFFSNGSNITDGIDGLATGISFVIFIILSLFSIISSNSMYSKYFHIMYIPHSKEIIVFSLAFLGTLMSFFWYNAYPAQIFMGDTGSLTIGSLITTLSIINRKEFVLSILCGIFFIENISVLIQVLYWQFSKRKYVIGKKVFLMAPIHHHFQKLGYHENKIFHRFFIIQIILSLLSIFVLLM